MKFQVFKMRKANILIIFLTTVCLLLTPVNAFSIDDNLSIIQRFEGYDRYQTSKAIAEQYQSSRIQNIILASGNNYPDALACSVLAHKLKAPILLVNRTASSTIEAFQYINNHLDPSGNIYMIGGSAVIKADFHTKLKSMGYSNITQIGGADRYETSLLIAQSINPTKGMPVFVTTGLDFPYALTISSFAAYNGWPILLVNPNKMSDSMKSYLKTLQPSEIYIAGKTSEVSSAVEKELSSAVPGARIVRMSGTDKYSTLISIIKTFSSYPNKIYLASGSAYPDALSGSVLAAATGSPIILLDPKQSTPPKAVADYLKELDSPEIYVFGGIAAVPELLAKNVQNAIKGIQPISSENLSASGIYEKYGQSTAYLETFDSSGQLLGQGTGFLVAKDKVATNYHVIKNAHSVKVSFPSGQVYNTSEIYGYDENRDIAMLKITPTNLPPLPLGNSDTTEVGENIVVISNPLGLSNTVSTGNISSVDRYFDNQSWFQITASVSSGSSGGPVFNSRGEVTGIVTWGLVKDTAQNLNFIIPINTVKGIISQNNVTLLADIFPIQMANKTPSTGSLSFSEFEDYIWDNYYPLLDDPYVDYVSVEASPFTLSNGKTSLNVTFFVDLNSNINWSNAQIAGKRNAVANQLLNIFYDAVVSFPQYNYFSVTVYFNDFFEYYPSLYNPNNIHYVPGLNKYQLFYYIVRFDNWLGYLTGGWNNNIMAR
ncbi:MAG: trypsin-like serine protease [Peptococcaceae bacterium]|nr:trypsin-like serine protease [Peptococcaceae bacterium]